MNVATARNHPGVVAVLTHEDVKQAGFGPMPVSMPDHRDGRPTWKPHIPVLAHERVRYVGELVACVIAETPQAATDAVEGISRVSVTFPGHGNRKVTLTLLIL